MANDTTDRELLEAPMRDDDVLQALGLSPDQFRTEGGAINRGKLRAAILHPYNYLPEEHWLQARFSKPGGRPPTAEVIEQAEPFVEVYAYWPDGHREEFEFRHWPSREELPATAVRFDIAWSDRFQPAGEASPATGNPIRQPAGGPHA